MLYSEFQHKYLGDICKVKGGKRLPKGKVLTATPTDHPYVRIRDMYQHKYINLNQELEFVDDETFESIKRYTVNYGDVIIAIVGNTIGLVSVIGKTLNGANLTENCVKLVDLKGVLSEYLYYYLNSVSGQMQIKSGIIGTSQPKLPIYNIEKISIKIPSLEYQEKVVSILASFDEKIELNNRMDENLQSLSQLLFKNWFIDFEFPNEEGLPYKSSGGEMVDSELGMIPKGWEARPLYDYATFINGTSFKQGELFDEGLPIVKIAELKDGITSGTKYFKGEKDKKYTLNNGDILFSWSGNPDTSIDTFLWYRGEAILNQHIFKVIVENNQEYAFVYLMLKYFKTLFAEIARNKQTTGLGHVTVSDLKRLKFVYNEESIVRFNEIVSSLVQLQLEKYKETLKLTNLRDILLPKLMSGEIDLSNLEANI